MPPAAPVQNATLSTPALSGPAASGGVSTCAAGAPPQAGNITIVFLGNDTSAPGGAPSGQEGGGGGGGGSGSNGILSRIGNAIASRLG